jgi:hypothetical protein
VHWLKGNNITSFSILNDIGTSSSLDDEDELRKYKKEFQRYALKAIKLSKSPPAIERIRYKVDRWHGMTYGLTGLPGHYSPLIATRLVNLGKLVAPRVHAAVFTTLWNGWCTHRRFQLRQNTSNVCKFKCSLRSEDSLEHYVRCPVVLKVAKHCLHFSYPDEAGINLWMMSSPWLDLECNLRGLALLIYGAYMGFNSIRHSSISNEGQAFHCIVQHIKQGAAGHAKSIAHLDSCWQKPISFLC